MLSIILGVCFAASLLGNAMLLKRMSLLKNQMQTLRSSIIYEEEKDEPSQITMPDPVQDPIVEVTEVEEETASDKGEEIMADKAEDRQLTKEEEAFLDRCRKIVEENLDNDTFSIETMAKSLTMSHSSLYKKVRDLTGLSLIRFINDLKIKRAVIYFDDGHTNVNTVAEMCGFRDVKAFREAFRKHTGSLPKQYVQQKSK